MDNSIWKTTLKSIVFLWGAISLGLITLVILFLIISNNINFSKGPKLADKTIHQATFGDVKLDMVRKYGDKEPEIFISMTDKDKNIVSNYLLPTRGTDFGYMDINDSIVLPSAKGKYRIMLFTVSGECGELDIGSDG